MSEYIPEKFAADVVECVDAINEFLAALAQRFDNLVILAALAEHMGGALRSLR